MTEQFNQELSELFSPRGVAVVGASRDPTKLGYGVARNLVVSRYPGQLHFVNPHGGRLFDRPLYPDLASVPDPVDLAIIMIPSASVPGALKACGERGIRFAVVGAGGFKEVGPEGLALEQRCMEIARQYEIRVLGPNSIGYLDTHLPIDTSFLPLPGPIPGDIAFLSHSGAVCEAVIDWARGQGFGLSRLISLGNQMDLTEGDLLPPTGNDPNTKVIAMYLEGVGDGSTFIDQARMVTREKPVIAIKVGRSERGRNAIASHTGVLAGEDKAFDAAFQKAGIIRARHSEEMFDWARALAWCPLPPGPRMAILTNAGGPGAIAADALIANQLEISDLTEETRRSLQQILPSEASVRNPVDILASAGPREYAESLRLLLEDPGVDGIMVILPPPPVSTAADVAGALIPAIRSASKPVVFALMGEALIAHAATLLRQAKIPDYRFPERAASALRVLSERSSQLRAPVFEVSRIESVQPGVARKALSMVEGGQPGFVSPKTASAVVEAFGIPVPGGSWVSSQEEAVKVAERIGYPVALKVSSPDLPHKSDIGGVLLGLAKKAAVADGYEQVIRSARANSPKARDLMAMIQPMAEEGQDVILGFTRDKQFGPLIMFGSGGIEVEGLKDVAFALAPLTSSEAENLMEATWAGRKLHGYRHLAPADRDAVIDSLLRLSQLAMDMPEVEELEINPLRVFEKGVLALDIRMRISS